jgi:hypothetical protein
MASPGAATAKWAVVAAIWAPKRSAFSSTPGTPDESWPAGVGVWLVDDGPARRLGVSVSGAWLRGGPSQSHCSSARDVTGCGLPMTARAMKKLIWPIAMVRVASAFSS